MASFHIQELKETSAQRLAPRLGTARRMAAVFTLVAAALSLGGSGLHLLLSSQISQTGGIGGLGLRSVLQTIQEILRYGNMIFSPLWSAGFLYAMLRVVRQEELGNRDLLEGFRRWGRILSGCCFEYLMTLMLAILVSNVTAFLYSFTSGAREMAQVLQPFLDNLEAYTTGQAVLTQAQSAEILSAVAPMLLLLAALLIPSYLYMTYSFRMARYLIMERPISGSRAYFLSSYLLRGNKWQVLKLDLSYWWYHLLGALVGLVAYLDILLSMLGIALPLGETFWFFLTLILHCTLLLALNVWKKPQVDCAYLTLFEEIAHPGEA